MFEQFIGTKPVEERHRIDVAALEKFLNLKISSIEQFKGGQSNPTYRISSPEGRLSCDASPQASCCPPRMPSSVNTR